MRIGIGAGADIGKVLAAARGAGPGIEACVYTTGEYTGDLCDPCLVIRDLPENALVKDLVDGRIDAAVRGSLPSNTTLRALKEATGVPHLLRIALLSTREGRAFLLAPVGVDEGWTVEEKVELIERGRGYLALFGLPGEVAVLSGGRHGDLGRHPAVDRSIAQAELVARLTGAVNREILIEDAIGSAGLIIAPDGISGNLIFRTLVHLGEGHAHGAPVVNIDRIFVDTSRASPDYADALITASVLAKR
ncbi:MAG TPA: methanogenesis marker protein Mmp4/MtxX [Methanomicrobiales archaeon]|jgi:putative methanogen marker protein 4|nr:methanogenesis marker protein Mmp4/MtxX [Methanomicrobiales archaeon]